MKKVLTTIALLFPLIAVSSDDLKPYPSPEAGFERFVFRVPETANDHHRKVEIVIGKVIPVDCNRTMFMGNIEEFVAEGWGYPYYVVGQINGPASTLMGCEDDQKTDQFVPVRGEGFLRRYNHKLPVVVYVPEGFEVRYRIWFADEALQAARPE